MTLNLALIKPISAILGMVALSACETTWCGEVDLGNRFVLTTDKPIQIIHCTSNTLCCNVGYPSVPGSVEEYGCDDTWIVAKRKSGDFWIIDKRFDIDWSIPDVPGRHEFFESHIIGSLSRTEFERLLDSLNITITMQQAKTSK